MPITTIFLPRAMSESRKLKTTGRRRIGRKPLGIMTKCISSPSSQVPGNIVRGWSENYDPGQISAGTRPKVVAEPDVVW